MHSIATVYPWATIGGVERVIINRAEAFRYAGLNIKTHAYFYSDSGGAHHMQSYIDSHNLSDYLNITFNLPKASIFFCIDEPNFIKEYAGEYKVQLECHTHYAENRKYLHDVCNLVKSVAVPSDSFRKELINECGAGFSEIFVLRNLVPWELHNTAESIKLPCFGKLKPILWLGRSDELKNTKRLIKTISDYRKNFGDEFLLLLIGPISESYELKQYIKLHQMEDRALSLPPISFERIPSLMEAIRNQSGIFASASKGETFGLSAAEAIAGGVPVLLSDIPAHSWLVGGDTNHLFSGDDDFCEKMHTIARGYNPSSEKMLKLRTNFGIESFIRDFSSRNYL